MNKFIYNDLFGIKFDYSGTDKLIMIDPFIPDDLSFARGQAITIPHNTKGIFNCRTSSDNYDIWINSQLIIKNGVT